MYEFNGIVKKIGDVQTFSSGFQKRELVVEEEKEGKWKNIVAVCKISEWTPSRK